MAIAFRGATQITDGLGDGTRALPLPSGSAAGDSLLIVYFNAVGTTSWTDPVGWSQLSGANGTQSTQGQIVGAYRSASVSSGEIADTSAGPNGTVSVSLTTSTNALAVAAITLTGLDTTTPSDISASIASSSSTFTGPPEPLDLPASSSTSVTDSAVVVSVATARTASVSWSSLPGSLTQLLAGSSAADAANLWIGYTTLGAAGSSFAATTVSASAWNFHLGMTVVLRPSTGGGGGLGPPELPSRLPTSSIYRR